MISQKREKGPNKSLRAATTYKMGGKELKVGVFFVRFFFFFNESLFPYTARAFSKSRKQK